MDQILATIEEIERCISIDSLPIRARRLTVDESISLELGESSYSMQDCAELGLPKINGQALAILNRGRLQLQQAAKGFYATLLAEAWSAERNGGMKDEEHQRRISSSVTDWLRIGEGDLLKAVRDRSFRTTSKPLSSLISFSIHDKSHPVPTTQSAACTRSSSSFKHPTTNSINIRSPPSRSISINDRSPSESPPRKNNKKTNNDDSQPGPRSSADANNLVSSTSRVSDEHHHALSLSGPLEVIHLVDGTIAYQPTHQPSLSSLSGSGSGSSSLSHSETVPTTPKDGENLLEAARKAGRKVIVMGDEPDGRRGRLVKGLPSSRRRKSSSKQAGSVPSTMGRDDSSTSTSTAKARSPSNTQIKTESPSSAHSNVLPTTQAPSHTHSIPPSFLRNPSTQALAPTADLSALLSLAQESYITQPPPHSGQHAFTHYRQSPSDRVPSLTRSASSTSSNGLGETLMANFGNYGGEFSDSPGTYGGQSSSSMTEVNGFDFSISSMVSGEAGSGSSDLSVGLDDRQVFLETMPLFEMDHSQFDYDFSFFGNGEDENRIGSLATAAQRTTPKPMASTPRDISTTEGMNGVKFEFIPPTPGFGQMKENNQQFATDGDFGDDLKRLLNGQYLPNEMEILPTEQAVIPEPTNVVTTTDLSQVFPDQQRYFTNEYQFAPFSAALGDFSITGMGSSVVGGDSFDTEQWKDLLRESAAVTDSGGGVF